MIILNKILLKVIIILHVCFLKEISTDDFECQYNKSNLICYNFTDFSQLNLNNYEVDHVIIWPSNPLILNKILNLNGLNYNAAVRNNIDFYNIKGIDFEIDPFRDKKSFDFNVKFYQTDFSIFNNGLILNENNCKWNLVDENFTNIFSKLNQLEIEYGGHKNLTSICPIIFKNANINSFTIQDLSSDLITFTKLDPNQKLNSNIDKLNFLNVNISLNENFLSDMVFSNVKYLTIELSNLENIQTDLFKNFKYLKNLFISVIDFKSFFTVKVGAKWMNFLNFDVNVNLNNETDIINNIDKQFKLSLNDWYVDEDNIKFFLYTDYDFCLFTEFPHNKLVFPVINIGRDHIYELYCSCTVLFLIQYRKYYNRTADPTNDIDSDSVNHCFHDLNFEQSVIDCNFEQKILDCNSSSTKITQDSATSLGLITSTKAGCSLFQPFCTCGSFCNCILCENFRNLNELSEIFNKINYTLSYESLEIVSNQIFLDKDFDMSNLKFSNEVIKLELRNLIGMKYDVDPLKENKNTKINLFINYEKFDVYYNDSSILDENLCNWDIINNESIFKNIITYTVNLTIIPSVQKSSNKICPLIFKNAFLSNFVTSIPKNISFSFYELSDEQELNTTIDTITIAQSKFYLDSRILNKMIFSNTKEIFIEYSDLYGIEPLVFKPLKNLKKLYMTIFNLDQLFNNGTEWLSYLNNQVNVDLNNEAEIENNIKSQFTLIFGNIFGQFHYKEEDFCLFKNFPHEHLVFPFIFSGDTKLNCTCTIAWLIQYRHYYNYTQDQENMFDSDSVNHCINENFQTYIEQCQFEQKIKNCSYDYTTIDIQTTIVNNPTSKPNSCTSLGQYCSCGENYISCSNFKSFSDINFNNFNVSIDNFYITLKPYFFTKIILDNSLDMSGLDLIYNAQVELNLDNLFGIDLEVTPFRIRKNFSFLSIGNNSIINIFKGNKILDGETCKWDIIDNDRIFRNVFSDVNVVELKPNYKTNYLCPLIFLNAKIETLIIEGQVFKFYDLVEHQNKTLNCSIKNLSIFMRQFYLDSKTLDKRVFAQTTQMNLQAYNFYGIEKDTFKEFYMLKQLSLISSDFSSFIKNGTQWMNTLNYNTHVNEININTVKENEKNAMALFLVDILKNYYYPDEDICLFKDFPHNNLVVPIFFPIHMFNNLNCTCSLLYLIQYRVFYDNSFFQYSQMIIDAASKCIDGNFQKRITECKFETRFQNCSSSFQTTISTSSVSTLVITSPTLNTMYDLLKQKNKTIDYLIAGVSTMGFFAFVLLILIVFMGFKFISLKKIAKHEEFSLIPSDILTDD